MTAGTDFPEVEVGRFDMHLDNRGGFMQMFCVDRPGYIQSNLSWSKKATFRGMHWQVTSPQTKWCTVLDGEVYDVVVDLRKGSDTFGKWMAVFLEKGEFIKVPTGFAHGFYACEDSLFLYLVDTAYNPKDEAGFTWKDPEIGITLPGKVRHMSEKDRKLPFLKDAVSKEAGYDSSKRQAGGGSKCLQAGT